MSSFHRGPRTVLSVLAGVGCLLAGACTSGPSSSMTVTVSTPTPPTAPVTLTVDSDQRAGSGIVGPSIPPTPVDLAPDRPTGTVTIPTEGGNWVRVRVAAVPAGSMPVACELRAPDGHVVARTTSGTLAQHQDVADCEGTA